MENNYLDHIVKKALDKLDVPYSEQSWAQLEQDIQLDPELNPDAVNGLVADTLFDESIKKAITTPSLATPLMDWSKMESLIEQDPSLALEDFDLQFKDGLENIEAPYSTAPWDMLEAQLDFEDSMQELNDTGDVDHVVYNKISNLQADSKTSNWRALSHKLEIQPEYRQGLVLRYKVAEMALFLLLFITIFNFLPLSTPPVEAEKAPLIAQNEVQSESDKIVNDKVQKDIPSTAVQTKSESNLTKSLPSKANHTKGAIQKNIEIPNILPPAGAEVLGITSNIPSKIVPRETVVASSAHSTNQISFLAVAESTLPEKVISEKALIKKIDPNFYPYEFSLLALPKKDINFISLNEETKLPGCLTCKMPKTISYRAGMSLLGNYNYIMTPDDRIFDKASYNNASLGYGLGASFGISYGNWEVETGAKYVSVLYQLEPLTETLGSFESGYFNRSLTEIELNFLQIPLGIRYNFDKLKSWNFSSIAGAALNVAAQTTHNLESKFIDETDFRNNIGQPVRAPEQSNTELIAENSSFNQKDFADGWLEGGSFLENRYFTFNAGLGLERALGLRYNLFIQAMYQHTILSNGFGANNVSFNTLSLETGVKAKIGKKIKVYQKSPF